MPFIDRADMLTGAPLPGWSGRFFHSDHMTFAHWSNTPHSVKVVGGCRAIIVDYPVRLDLPGRKPAQAQ